VRQAFDSGETLNTLCTS